MDMTAQRIVMRHAEAAFEVGFDSTVPAEHAALTEFRGAILPARTREDLAEAWMEIPVLKARGADFLEVQIFARAARDSDWPAGGPPLDERTVYVEAVGVALNHVLAGGQEEER